MKANLGMIMKKLGLSPEMLSKLASGAEKAGKTALGGASVGVKGVGKVMEKHPMASGAALGAGGMALGEAMADDGEEDEYKKMLAKLASE
jgi:hypothetical protein